MVQKVSIYLTFLGQLAWGVLRASARVRMTMDRLEPTFCPESNNTYPSAMEVAPNLLAGKFQDIHQPSTI